MEPFKNTFYYENFLSLMEEDRTPARFMWQ